MNILPANPPIPSPATSTPPPPPPPTDSTQSPSLSSDPNTNRNDTIAANEVRHGDRIKISGAARELASRIASATETNETAVQEASESSERQQIEQEQLAAPNKQPPVNQATQKTITTRIDVVA